LLVTALASVIGNDKASKIAHYAMDRDLTQTEDAIVGTGAGERCRDLDRRKIDLRQRRDRGDDANKEDRRHDQRGRDGVPDEGGQDIHCGATGTARSLLSSMAGDAHTYQSCEAENGYPNQRKTGG
jgi:hypothetical protein